MTRLSPCPRPSPALTVLPRACLHTGRIVAGRIEGAYVSTIPQLARQLVEAHSVWFANGQTSALVLSLPERLSEERRAADIDQAVRDAGLAPGDLIVEIDERILITRAAPLAEALRALGHRIALRADPACPLPFGGRARALYQEVIVASGPPPSLYLGASASDPSPLGRRLYAAREAGLALVALGADSTEAVQAWRLAGFDAAEGAAIALPAMRVQPPAAAAARFGATALSLSSR